MVTIIKNIFCVRSYLAFGAYWLSTWELLCWSCHIYTLSNLWNITRSYTFWVFECISNTMSRNVIWWLEYRGKSRVIGICSKCVFDWEAKRIPLYLSEIRKYNIFLLLGKSREETPLDRQYQLNDIDYYDDLCLMIHRFWNRRDFWLSLQCYRWR